MDILFPPDLVPTTMQFGVDDFTAVDESATTGGMQSSSLYGTRRWHLRMDFAVLSRKTGSLARFEALVASLRGRANRVWISPAPAAKLRGSFPAAEMFVNNDFSFGTNSWTSDAQYSLAPLDHGIRATRIAASATSATVFQSVTVSKGVPYNARYFINAGKGSIASIYIVDFTDVTVLVGPILQGMLGAAYTPGSSSGHTIGLNDNQQAIMPSSFFDAKWASFSRCAQADNGVNLLLNSDTPGGGTGWTLTAATAAASGGIGPDGLADAWGLTETATTSSHFTVQAVIIPAGVADYTMSAFVKAGLRSWCFLQFQETLSGTAVSAFYNVSTGALGSTPSVGANFSLISSVIVDYGNGWKRVILTVRKTNAAIGFNCFFGAASADNTSSYLGSTSSAALLTWRASVAQSSFPVQAVATAATQQLGTGQTGFSMNLKGLPVSTQGLLLEGDVVECMLPNNSQLLRVVSRLDSDAAGLGTLIFENALKQSPIDGAGVVVQQPMGRFVLLASSAGIEYTPGVFGQASLEFVEAA